MNGCVIKAAIACAILVLLSCVGFVFPLQIVLAACFGWAFYLRDVLSTIAVNWWGVATAIVTFAVFACGVHWLAGWLSTAADAGPSETGRVWRCRWSMATVAIVVLTFSAGISVVGMAHQAVWLLTSPGPFLQNSFEAALRSQSRHNLSNIGLAFHQYHDLHESFPAGGTFDAFGVPQHSWQSMLLPWIDQKALYDKISLDLPWHHPQNASAFGTLVSVYRNPGIKPKEELDSRGYALSHYAANGWLVGGGKARAVKEIVDGTSNTILAGEVNENFKPWGDPSNWRDPGLGINTSPEGFGGPWGMGGSMGGAHLLLADGSVRFVSSSIDPKILKALRTPDGGEPVGDF